MAGFENNVVVAVNVNFDDAGPKPHLGIITQNGQLMIGSATAPYIRAGFITSPMSTLNIGYSGGNITADVKSGSSTISITGDSGGAQISNAFTFTGGTSGLTFAGATNTFTLGGVLVGANGGTGIANTGLTINLGSGVAGYVLTSDSSGNGTWQASGGGGGVNYLLTTFNMSGTWTPNAKTVSVTGIIISGGSGGGSGYQGATTAAGGGGGAGSGGFLVWDKVPISFFGVTESITVGAFGNGGNAQTSSNTGGNPGSNAGYSGIGNLYYDYYATSNAFGPGGTTTSTAGPVAGMLYKVNSFCQVGISFVSSAGGNGAKIAGFAAANQSLTLASASISPINFYASGGGGGGAGADSGTARQGGTGASLYDSTSTNLLLAGGTGGIEGGTLNGGDGNTGLIESGFFTTGTGGGGGGGQHVGGSAGNGGKGAFPGGSGGGGGGSINGTNSGAGGNGANGQVVIIEWFT